MLEAGVLCIMSYILNIQVVVTFTYTSLSFVWNKTHWEGRKASCASCYKPYKQPGEKGGAAGTQMVSREDLHLAATCSV